MNFKCIQACSSLKYSFKNETTVDNIINSLALIQLGYDEGNKVRFCMGVFFAKYLVLTSRRCLNLNSNESMLNVYGGFKSWDIDLDLLKLDKSNQNLTIYEIESVDTNVKYTIIVLI